MLNLLENSFKKCNRLHIDEAMYSKEALGVLAVFLFLLFFIFWQL